MGECLIVNRPKKTKIKQIINFTYTGEYIYLSEGGDNWKIKFLTSGTFKPESTIYVDLFLVGGGSGGTQAYNAGTGGGGGYTNTQKIITLFPQYEYEITIGAGGIAAAYNRDRSGNPTKIHSESFTVDYIANGGNGQNGGSGGGGKGYNGGTDGGDGVNGGNGQNTTTREFGENNGALYAAGGGGPNGLGGDGGGGNGATSSNNATTPTANSGSGGGGSNVANSGASNGADGIVIMRNSRN